ncbi:MAG: ferritin family protein [Deltaproteobacteria bacterium]|nr:ferritin family protein [Deltaproteobacteria bacterium]
MADKVTNAQILDLAIQMEQKGHEFYSTAAQLVKEPGAKQLLEELAADEVHHEALFRSIQEKKDFGVLATGEVPQDLKLSDYLIETDLGPRSSPQEIMVTAMKMEQNAVNLYSQWLTMYKGTEVETLIQGLVDEEKRHKDRLETVYHDIYLEDQ